MKKSVPTWQMAGFIFTSILGTFLHFLFDLAGGSAAAALVSAVNESIWEHMKLIYYPMVLFSFIEYRVWGKEMPGFWCVKMKGVLLALVLIPLIYYLYTGALGYRQTGSILPSSFWLLLQLIGWKRSCSRPDVPAISRAGSPSVYFC